MKLVAHLLVKDARAARGVWIVWLALVVVDVWWQGVGPRWLFETAGGSDTVNAFRALLPLSELGVLLLLVSTIVHEDPIVDPAAFWHTRPIGPRRLFLAKLAAVGLLAIGPPLVAETLRLLWLRVPATDIARIDFEIALGLAVPLLVAFAVAAITSNLARYVMVFGGAFVSLLIAVATYNRLVSPARRTWWPGLPGVDGPAQFLIGMLVLIAGALWVVRDHFRRRDWRLAAVGLACVVGATQLLDGVWPRARTRPDVWRSRADQELTDAAPGHAWANPARTRLRRVGDEMGVGDVDEQIRRVGFLSAFNARGQRTVAVPLALDGLPEDYTASPSTVEGRLEYADGTVATSGVTPAVQRPASSRFEPSMVPGYGRFPLPSGPTTWEVWPVLVDLPRDVANRKVGEPGRFTGTFRYRLARHEPVATLPLIAGATHADGPRGLVVRLVADTPGRCWVRLETWGPALRLSSDDEPALGFHFVDNLTGEKVRTAHQSSSVTVGAGFRPDFSGLGRPFGMRYAAVTAEDLDSREAPGGPRVPRPCRTTGLVVVRTTPAGTLTRSLELPDFRIDPRFDVLSPR